MAWPLLAVRLLLLIDAGMRAVGCYPGWQRCNCLQSKISFSTRKIHSHLYPKNVACGSVEPHPRNIARLKNLLARVIPSTPATHHGRLGRGVRVRTLRRRDRAPGNARRRPRHTIEKKGPAFKTGSYWWTASAEGTMGGYPTKLGHRRRRRRWEH